MDSDLATTMNATIGHGTNKGTTHIGKGCTCHDHHNFRNNTHRKEKRGEDDHEDEINKSSKRHMPLFLINNVIHAYEINTG